MNKKWKKPRPGRIRTTTFDYEACVPSLGYNHCTAFQLPSQILNCRMTRNDQRVAADSITERFNSNKWPSDETQEPNYNPSSIRDHLSGVEPYRNDMMTTAPVFSCEKKFGFGFRSKLPPIGFLSEKKNQLNVEIEILRSCGDFISSRFNGTKWNGPKQLLMLIKSPNS